MRLLRLPGPNLKLLGKPRSLFQICGSAGMAAAIVLATFLAGHAGLSFLVAGGIFCIAVPAFLALVMVTKIVTGEEKIIYYHHEIGITLATLFFLLAIRQPVLPYLDVTILAIGLILACGRIGCLTVGCCHGRPYRWGLRYRKEHAAAGFPFYLVGVRLFPVQAVESLCVLLIVVQGVAMVWLGSPAGSAFAWYVVAYDLGRFAFEFARGDAERPYWRGFSQPQWLSLILTACVALAELSGWLPLYRWHVMAALLIPVGMLGVAIWRRFYNQRRFLLLHPSHIREMAAAREIFFDGDGDGAGGRIPMVRTSLGVLFSGGELHAADAHIRHYSLSFVGERDQQEAAEILAQLIARLEGATGPVKLLGGNRDVFHLLVETVVAAP